MVTTPPAPKPRHLNVSLTRRIDPPTPLTECYVILGRHGDLTNILPVLLDQALKLGQPVPVVVCDECAPLLDGTSYIQPLPLDLSCDKLDEAEEWARARFQAVRTVQVWGNGSARSHLMSHYNEDAWLMAGRSKDFSKRDLRPVFDSRSPKREKDLVDRFWSRKKPLMLMAVRGGYSSPFRQYAQMADAILNKWGNQYEVLDLDLIKAKRIYDLLGLMDAATVLVSADSAHLHLAAASKIPVVALLSDRNFWAQTSPRCDCIWQGTYPTAVHSIAAIHEAIGRCPQKQQADPARVIHVTDGFWMDRPGEPRHRRAFTSWLHCDTFKAHLPSAVRTSDSVGCRRRLPFLKEVLSNGLAAATDKDVIVWTNSDTIILPGAIDAIRKAIQQTPVVTARRIDFATSKPAPGRDLCAFRSQWLRDRWLEIPDFICGAAELDNWMALVARREIGQNPTANQLGRDAYPADLPTGYIQHLDHGTPYWDNPNVRYSDPGNLYNLHLLQRWCRNNGSNVRFYESGHVNWKI